MVSGTSPLYAIRAWIVQLNLVPLIICNRIDYSALGIILRVRGYSV